MTTPSGPRFSGPSPQPTPANGSPSGPALIQLPVPPTLPTAQSNYSAPRTLELRTDLQNPIRTGSRRIATLGDVREGIITDFFGGQLRENGRGVQVVQQLGSFPGFRHPQRPLSQWNPDQKPDFNLVGESEVILRRLQPVMGWNAATLAQNIELARRGMVYFNQAIETPVGPIPFKMGILDTRLWQSGHPYFEIRASLLPFEETYRFLGEGDANSTITPESFRDRHRAVEAEWMGKTLATFTQESFSAAELMLSRYTHNFGYYERYRVFDRSKGPKQLRKYQNTSRGDIVPEILVPGFQRWLSENAGLLEVNHPELGRLTADQVTLENFTRLQFTWTNTQAQRNLNYRLHLAERAKINGQNWEQTRINITSNKTSRASHHSVGWVDYGIRKIGRWFGIESQSYPRSYTEASSRFTGMGHVTAEAQRLGMTENPIDQMIVLAGYGPETEADPKTWNEMITYAEAEIGKGAKPNILIKGNNPSKFTFPLGGVPAIAYRFIDGLRTAGMKTIIVVGPPDVGATLEAFQNHFADEIRQSGKEFIYVDTGTGRGGFTTNLLQGLDRLPKQDGIALLAYGDTPRVGLLNVANNPWRHNIDYIFGANGRDMVLDFMGMNAHYQADVDGVGYASKEGNVQAVRRNFPVGFWQRMFENRKSMVSGPMGKIIIGLEYALIGRGERSVQRTGSILGSLLHPNVLDVPHMIAFDIGLRSVRNVIQRLGVPGAKPPWAAMDAQGVEDLIRNRLNWNIDVRARGKDPGGLVDIDGIRDYVVADVVGKIHPHEHQADLDAFARETLGAYRDRIPALDNTPERLNNIYLRMYDDLLAREGQRLPQGSLGRSTRFYRGLLRWGSRSSFLWRPPFQIAWGLGQLPERIPGLGQAYRGLVTNPLRNWVFRPIGERVGVHWNHHFVQVSNQEKLGINEALLNRLGFNPEVLPYTEDGRVNDAWLERVVPQRDLENFKRAFVAYERRGPHAEGLHAAFQQHVNETRPATETFSVSPQVENFVLRRLSADPQRMRGLVLEWDFDRVERAIVDQATRRFGEGAPEIESIQEYFTASTKERYDTRLRRVLRGFKAADAIRRYESHLSPAEFQEVFPNLIESMVDAENASPRGEGRGRWPISYAGFPHLRGFFRAAQGSADQAFIRKVGESPPLYRNQTRLSHSNEGNPILRGPSGTIPAGRTMPFSLDAARALRGNILRADSQVFLQSDINQFVRRLNILPSRVPELISVAAGANNLEGLSRVSGSAATPSRGGSNGDALVPEIPTIPSERIAFDRLRAWSQSAEGQVYLRDNAERLQNSFRNRALVEHGPGLLVGIAALLGAERVADVIGLDPARNPHERFMFVVGASHLVQSGFTPVHEVLTNRIVHRTPYDFVTTRMVSGGSEGALQYSFQARSSTMRSVGASLARNYTGVLSSGRNLLTLPIRASWNMGAGLMSSALTDRIVSEGMLGLEQGSGARRAIHFGSFFLPDLYRIGVGNRGSVFFRSRGMRFAARAFAVGFMADMGFSAINRIQNGSEGSTLEGMIYQRANELNDDSNNNCWVVDGIDGALEFVAPQVAAWWDSVEFDGFSLRANSFQNEAREELASYSQHVEENTHSVLQQRLIHGIGDERYQTAFYTSVNLEFLRGNNALPNENQSGARLPTRLLADDLANSPRFRQRLNDAPDAEARARVVQSQYSGWRLSPNDVEVMLAATTSHRMRSDLSSIQHIPLSQNQDFRFLFNQSGELLAGRENALLSQTFDQANMTQDQLLQARRLRLVVDIERLGASEDPADAHERGRLTAVAQRIGLMDTSGQWTNDQVVVAGRQQWAARQPQQTLIASL